MGLSTELRFKVLEEDFGIYSVYKLYDSQTEEYVSILPHLGGSVNEMVLKHKGELIPIIDGYKTVQDSSDNLGTTFKGSNLFPFPNRIADGKYAFEGENYVLPLNFPQENNAIHGLIYNKTFEVIEHESGEISCQLFIRYIADEAVEGYPFNYMLEVTYKLHVDEGFLCTTKIYNRDDRNILIGHGWHPYFISGNASINDLMLQFPADEILEVDKRSIPTGKTEKYNTFNQLRQIESTQLDNCFLLEQTDKQAEIHIVNNARDFKYAIWQETGIHKYNYLQIYTPPHRKSIAIEPMTCAPDAFNNGQGLIVLSPLEGINLNWGIRRL